MARTRPHRACGSSRRPGLWVACLGLCWALCTVSAASAAGAPAAEPEAIAAQDAQTAHRGGLVVAAVPTPVAKAAASGPAPRARSYLVRALALAIGAGVAWLLNRLGRSADPPRPPRPPRPDRPADRDAHE